jgi:hypothetical protein
LREFHEDPETKRAELLSVERRWLYGHSYLLPSDIASVDEAHHVIHLPHTERWRQHVRERSQSKDRAAAIE